MHRSSNSRTSLRAVVVLVCTVFCAPACYMEASSTAFADRMRSGAHDDVGQARMLWDDFHSLSSETLETNAIAWKLVVASMLTAHAAEVHGAPSEQAYQDLLTRRYGWLQPTRIANWSTSSAQPVLDKPMGMVSGVIDKSMPRLKFEVVNHGCATCHAGNLWDKDGNPTREAWMGMPSTSINLASYSSDVYQALQVTARAPAATLATLDVVYPKLDVDEHDTLVHMVLPLIAARIGGKDAPSEPVPFDNGGPGITNAVAHMKSHLHVLDVQRGAHEVAFTQVPDFGAERLRSAVLCDGVYTPKGHARVHEEHLDDNMVARTRSLAQVTFFFTVSTLGLSPARAPENLEHVADVMEFTTHYTPPPFPGVVDATRAARGQKLYVAQCQSCHGTFEERDGRMVLTSFPNIIVPQAAMGSDDARWRSVDSDAIVALRKSPIGKTVDIASTGGYVAMTLTGAWASAPYMHNGSVPTLWDFLHPAERPKRFLVGGHRLDFKKLGIDQHIDASGAPAYPDGYVPWSTPALYDATTPGRTNSGHEAQFAGLSEDDKSDLLEFMKRL